MQSSSVCAGETAQAFLSRLQLAPFTSAAEITTLASIARCLCPPNTTNALDGFANSDITSALKNWVYHAQDLCLLHRPQWSLREFLSKMCRTWKLDHSYANPVSNRNDNLFLPNRPTPATPCELVDYLDGAKFLCLFWYLHQPSVAHSGASLLLAAEAGDAKLVKHLLQMSLSPTEYTAGSPTSSHGSSTPTTGSGLG